MTNISTLSKTDTCNFLLILGIIKLMPKSFDLSMMKNSKSKKKRNSQILMKKSNFSEVPSPKTQLMRNSTQFIKSSKISFETV